MSGEKPRKIKMSPKSQTHFHGDGKIFQVLLDCTCIVRKKERRSSGICFWCFFYTQVSGNKMGNVKHLQKQRIWVFLNSVLEPPGVLVGPMNRAASPSQNFPFSVWTGVWSMLALGTVFPRYAARCLNPPLHWMIRTLM